RDGVELEVGEDLGDFDAVRDVGIAVAPRLSRMSLLAEPIGAPEQLDVEALGEGLAAEIPAGDELDGGGCGHIRNKGNCRGESREYRRRGGPGEEEGGK